MLSDLKNQKVVRGRVDSGLAHIRSLGHAVLLRNGGERWKLLHRVPRAWAQVCVGWGAGVAWGEFIAAESMELLNGSESTSFDRSATLSF